MACETTTLSRTRHMRADTCACGTVHVALPNVTLRLPREAVEELHALLTMATHRLREERARPTLSVVEPDEVLPATIAPAQEVP